MSTAGWVKNTLDISGSHYKETHHPQAFTAKEVAKGEHVREHQMTKVIAVHADDERYLLVLPSSRRVSLPLVREILSAKSVRLVSEAEMGLLFPDCEIGAIPPMRHWPGVEILMDTTLEHETEIIFQSGSHKDAIRMPLKEWQEIVSPRVEAFSVLPDELEEI